MEFLSRKEAAKYFRVDIRTVERWLKNGILKGYKLGRGRTALWRIPKKEITRFLEKHKNKPKNA